MQVTDADFEVMKILIEDLCGIVLEDNKRYLIENRLAPIAKETGCGSYSELYYRVRHGQDLPLQAKIVDAITTHETQFFRDQTCFENLRKHVIPELAAWATQRGARHLRIWSAASSTGQEAYSIAMLLKETLLRPDSWNVEIIGTDISEVVVQKASAGIFDSLAVNRGLTPEQLEKSFSEVEGGWQINEDLRRWVRFEPRNLLESLAGFGAFDLILCRNVAVYFSNESRQKMFTALAGELRTDGFLVTGTAESPRGVEASFHPVEGRSGCYRRISTKTIA